MLQNKLNFKKKGLGTTTCTFPSDTFNMIRYSLDLYVNPHKSYEHQLQNLNTVKARPFETLDNTHFLKVLSFCDTKSMMRNLEELKD